MMLWVNMVMILLFVIGGCAPAKQQEKTMETNTGILILAHGAGEKWNKHIFEAVADIKGNFKKAIAFGMGNAETIQQSIDVLEKAGVHKIIVVPLFLSANSEMYRHIEYVLGVRNEPDALFLLAMQVLMLRSGHDNHSADFNILKKVKFKVPYLVAKPINYSPLIARILEDRLSKIDLSYSASVFILAHGPISEEDDKEWGSDLKKYTRRLSIIFGNAKFFGMTFRDDAPLFIKDSAIQKIREAIKLETGKGRKVIIVPFLLAPGGREEEIKKIFDKCGCKIIDGALLPHPNISIWIEKQIKLR
jgi:sirohydrochlorin cobaltochelatase